MIQVQTTKKMKMQQITFTLCISISIFIGLCSAISEREKRPLIYTDGLTGPGYKKFTPTTYRTVQERSGRPTISNQDTLSYQTSKFLLQWGNETNILLVGAKDHVYMMSGVLDDAQPGLTYHKLLTWKATTYKNQCLAVPNRNPDLCENYIQYIELLESGELLVCGSNAFHPTCRYYLIDHFSEYSVGNSDHVKEDDKCRGRCPASPYPTASSISLYSESDTGYQIFAALINADKDPIIMRNDGPTLLSNAPWLKDPTFIKMIEFQEHIYIFLREIAETSETGNHEQTYARVARICKNDKGGLHVLLNRWTTFIKARLVCDKTGKGSNIFNNLTSVSDLVPISGSTAEDADYYVFATFTSPWDWEEPSMSAVCAFSMKDIANDMNAGRLLGKYQAELRPTPESLDNRIPPPRPVDTAFKSYPIESETLRRPRTCEDNRAASLSALSLANDYNLLYDTVKPKFGKPLYITSDFRATQIAVDYKAGHARKVMIYVGSENGKLLRLRNMTTNANEWHLVLLESMRVAKEQQCTLEDCAVRSLHISRQDNSRPSIFVAFSNSIVQMPVARCEAYIAKECCTIDPDCGWNGISCTERHLESERSLSSISPDEHSVPSSCRALGMSSDCEQRDNFAPDFYVDDTIPPFILDEVIPTGQSLDDIMQSITSGSLERQFFQTSQSLGKKQIQAMKVQLQEAVTSTIKLVLENHKQEYCLPSPSVNQLVHVYPLLLNEIDLWHSVALKKMTAVRDPKCWDEKKPCVRKAVFSLPLVRVLWEPMEKLIENFSGSCKKIKNTKGRAAYSHSPTRACIPLPGLEKCNSDDSHENCQTTKCEFGGYAVDPIAFFRHANDTRNMYNPNAEQAQHAPLKKPVNVTLLNGQRVHGHLELDVLNNTSFRIYYSPVTEKVKIMFYYKPVKCKLDSLVDSLFDAAFDKMLSLRKCTREINRRDRKRRAAMKKRNHRRRSRNRRSDVRDSNIIYSPPKKCKFVVTKNIGTPELTVSESTWNKLVARSQKSGGVHDYRQETVIFTNTVDMLQFFKNDCPTISTDARKSFIKTIPKSDTKLTPFVSTEMPFMITRRKEKISLKFFYSTTLH